MSGIYTMNIKTLNKLKNNKISEMDITDGKIKGEYIVIDNRIEDDVYYYEPSEDINYD